MMMVWTDAAEAGILDRPDERGSMFAFRPRTGLGDDAVRLESWSVPSCESPSCAEANAKSSRCYNA
jgi:hypothetical protein